MRFVFRLVLIIYLFPQLGYSQGATLSGYVTDSTTGEALIGANLYEISSGQGVSSNRYGFYSLTLPKGQVYLSVSYMGYQTQRIDFSLQRDTSLAIRLVPATTQLQEVVVQDSSADRHQQQQIGMIRIPVTRLNAIPALLGEPDILKALTLTPGVSVGNEGTTGLLVRGGTPDQNLILLDDAPVYNVAHLFGLVSTFNSDAIKSVDLYKAAFPARFGGRLSSVLDVAMKEGNNQKFRGQASIGLISSRVLLEGPIRNERTSFMLSARGSYFGLLLLPVYISYKSGATSQYFNYWLYDVNAKMNHKFRDGSQLFVSLYNGNDFWRAEEGASSDRSKFGLTWGNTTATIRYSRVLHPKWFLKSVFTHSRYKYGINMKNTVSDDGQPQSSTRFYTASSVHDIAAKVGVEFFPSAAHQIRFGVEATHHVYRPTYIKTTYAINVDTLRKANEPIPAQEYAAYAEDEIKLTPWLRTNLGIRGAAFAVQQRTYTSLEPRVSATLLLPSQFAVKAGYSRMQQFIHLLSSNSVGLPNDIWVPATRNVLPQLSYQWALGVTKSVPSRNLELSVEGYYKPMRRLIDFRQGTNFLTGYNQNWENLVATNGKGEAYGMEAFVNKTKGRFTGWASYTWAWNRRQFSNINAGAWYPAAYDRRHTLALTGNFMLNEYIQFSANWVYYTGQPVTVPVALRKDFDSDFPKLIYAGRNNYRMPAYHRLDIGTTISKINRKGRRVIFTIGLYNAYNHANPYYLDFERLYFWEENNFGKITGTRYKLVKKSVLPILPYFSYSIQF